MNKYWFCIECERRKKASGWYFLSEDSKRLVCIFNAKHGNMLGPYDKKDFELVKPDRADRNWKSVLDKVSRITNGYFINSLIIQPAYYLEVLDPEHRYGPTLKNFFAEWAKSPRDKLFFEWLDEQKSTEKYRSLTTKGVIQLTGKQLVKYHHIRLSGNIIIPAEHFPVDWKNAIEEGKWNSLIFVMDEFDDIYIGLKVNGRFHHSSFFGGAPVKMAGTFEVDQSWKIKSVSNASGHYAPTKESLKCFLHVLYHNKVNLDLIELRYWEGKDWAFKGKATEWYNPAEKAKSRSSLPQKIPRYS